MTRMRWSLQVAAVSLAVLATSAGFLSADVQPVVNNVAAIPDIGSATLGGDLTAGDAADVTIYWGRSDGETNATVWDSAVLLPGLTNGPFSADVALGYGETYYFRCYATNATGDVWAASSTDFTALSPIVPPPLPVTGGLLAHWDAGSITVADGAQVDSWVNSQNPGTYDLTLMGGSPKYDAVVPGLNSKPAVLFSTGGEDWFSFSRINTIRTMFWVLRDARAIANEQFMLGDASTYHFHNATTKIWHGTHAHDYIKNGSTELNGTVVDGVNTDRPTDFGIISVVTTGNVQGNQLSRDRAIANRSWEGEMAEVLIYNQPLSSGDEDLVGGYLAWKYGLTTAYPMYTPPVTLAVTNTPASGIAADKATLNGHLMAPGWVFDVTVYWGATDGQAVPGNWENEMALGSYTNFTGDLTYAVTGLTGNSSYFYTYGAANSATNLWAAPSRNFHTLGMPLVSNVAPTDVTQTSATLNGELVEGGTGEATIYWGLTDGGTAPGAWEHTNAAGATFGTFSATVPVLAGGTYHYRSYVTNAIGDDWADLAETFTTPLAEVSLDLAIKIPDLGLDPTSGIPGCVLWIAADDIDGDGDTGDNPADGAPVNVWSDKSGLGHDVTRAGQVDPSLNTSGPNGRSVVTFDSDRDYMATAYNFDAHREYTILSVARFTGGASGRVISSATRNWLFGFHGNGVWEFHAEGWVYNGIRSDTDWHIHAGHINDEPDPKASFWVDGGLLVADDNGSGNGNHMIGRLGLGGYRDNNEESDCEIAEVLIYDRVLTPEELNKVGLYLDSKYGLNTAYAPVTETRGTITATATLSAPAISNVTVNVAFEGSNPPGLLHKGFHEQNTDNYLDLNNNGGLMKLAPYGTAVLTDGPAGRGLDFDADADFQGTGAVGQNDYYANLFIGYFHPPLDGVYLFRRAADDDRAGIWLDLDQDGVFESSTAGLGSNRGEQLSWEDAGAKEVELVGGERYMIAFTHREGTGGSQCDFRFSYMYGPEKIIKPSDPAQAGMWTYIEAASTLGSDYAPSALSVVIPAGRVSSNITITPIDDTEQEEDETSTVSIDSVVNAVIGSPSNAMFVISSDDPKVVNAEPLSIADSSAAIGGMLTMGDEASVRLFWGLTNGGTDPLQWDATNVMSYVAEDTLFSFDLTGLEAGQTYYYRCYATNDSSLGEDWADATSSFVTEGTSVSIDDIAVVEGNSGSVAAVFSVTLSAPSIAGVTVDYSTLDGDATVAGGDYAATNGTLSFPAGQVSTQVTVMVNGDRLAEGVSETFTVELSNVTGAGVGDGSGACAIEDDDVDVYLTSFVNRMPITFSGYAGGETLTNWPALLRVSEDIPGFSYASLASATGGDVRFANADGTKLLNFEIEVWNPTGESAIWVQVPELAGTDTRIWAYWGNAAETTLPTCATDGSTWDETFAAVYHLTSACDDSTPNVNDAPVFAGTPVVTNESMIGQAYSFDGSSRFRSADSPSLDLVDSITLSGWFNCTQLIQWRGMIAKGNDSAYELENGRGAANFRIRVNNAAGDGDKAQINNWSVDTWYYIVGTYDRQNTRLYRDGVLGDTRPMTAAINQNNTGLTIGARHDNNFVGILDEWRVSNVPRSDDWILASYENQKANSTFITPGSIESKPVLTIAAVATNIMANSAYTTATLTSTGTAETTVWVHWGETDGGEVPGNWANTQPMGTVTLAPPVTLTTNLTGLTGGTQYYCAFSASNSQGVAWASTAFFTHGLPFVENTPATPAVGYATLNGNLLSTGGAPTTVFTYWGETDGGTSTGAWDRVVTNGVLPEGAFSANTTAGLIYGRVYYCRSMATNANGAAWAASTTDFVTDREILPVTLPVTSGLDLWLDANDLDGGGDASTGDPSVGSNVSAWLDKSGQAPARDANELSSDPVVANGPNGTRVVSFDTDDYLATTNAFATPDYTIFGVSRYAGAARYRVISSRDTNWLFGHHGGMDERFYANGWIHDTGNNNTDWHVYAGHINSEADPKAWFWKDGVLLTSNDAGSGNGNHMPQKLQLNGYNGTGERSDSEIAEVIIYSRVLTSTEIEEVGAYLEWKYALGTAYDPDLYTPPSPITLVNEEPTDVTTNTATLNAAMGIPDADYDVWVYWGEVNGGKDAGQWSSSALVGSFTDTTTNVNHSVSGLVPGALYYYTFRISNVVHDLWAKPSARLELQGPPVISDDWVTTIAAPTARLSGGFATHTRGDVTLCWGLTDGGTNSIGDWEHSLNIGAQTNADFAGVVSPVYYSQTYHFCCYATNAYGDDWSDAVTFSVDIAPPGVPLEGLLGMWTFDDGTCDDVSGNGYDGVNGGGTYSGDVAPGARGQSIDLNGDKYVLVDTCGNQDVFDVDTLTVSCWVKEWPDDNWEPYISKRGETDGWQFRRYSDTLTDVCLTMRGPTGNNDEPHPATTINADGMWHHLVATYDGSVSRVYFDNMQIGQLAKSGAINDTESVLVFGGRDNSGGVVPNIGNISSAKLDDIAIYGRALTAEEIGDLYARHTLVPVVNDPPTDVTLTSMQANATVSLAGAVYDLWVYWGPTDGADNPATWATNAFLGTVTGTVGSVSHVASITAGITNYYAFRATNMYDDTWGTPSVVVAPVAGPAVNNDAGAIAGRGSATLQGELTAGGYADISVYWGRSDGDTNASAWDSVVSLADTPEGAFDTDVAAGYGVTYYYRCYAANAAGDAWASATTNFTVLVPPPPGIPVTSGLIAEYKFEDNADDTSGNSSHAALVGAASYVDGPVGRAVRLNAGGSGDYVDIPALNGGVESAGISYGMWVYLNENPPDMDVLMNHDGWAAGLIHFSTANNDQIRCDHSGGTGSRQSTQPLVNDGQWAYIVYATGFGSTDFYMDSDHDGVLTSAGTSVGTTRTVVNNVGRQIGGWNNGRWLQADIDEAVVYDRGISLVEAQQIYDFYLDPPQPLSITNSPVSNVSTDAVTMNGVLSADGWTFDIYACWGTNDEGTVVGNWDSSVMIGSVTNYEGALSHDITGLSVGPDYYCTFVAMNAVTNIGAVPSTTFQVLSAPTIANLPATDVTGNSASLNGDLVLGGSADITVYWGLSDGGTNSGDWDGATALGTLLAQPFAKTVGVLAGGRYYYRCYAENVLGTDWADTSETFMSLGAELAVADASLIEGDTGQSDMLFNVTLSDACASNVTVNFATADGAATAGQDYSAINGTLSITSGQSSVSVAVPIHGDRVGEYPSEDFALNLSSPVNAAIADGTGAGTIVDDDFDRSLSDWRAKMKITFSGYAGTNTLTNFPALVILNEAIPEFSYADFISPTGGDLRFSDGLGQRELNYEVEKWDPVGSSYVWVQVPELVDNTTYIWVYWKNSKQTNAPAYTTNGATWSEGFGGVWHMHAVNPPDSTANANDGTAGGTPTLTGGIAGDGLALDDPGDPEDDIVVEDADSIDPLNFTACTWISTTDPAGWYRNIMGNFGAGASGGSSTFWGLGWMAGSDLGFVVRVNGATTQLGGGALTDGTWHQLLGVRGGSDVKLYVDGTLANSGTQPGDQRNVEQLWFGNHGGFNTGMNGTIDEARVSTVVRSDDWIQASYSNQVPASTFATYREVDVIRGMILLIR